MGRLLIIYRYALAATLVGSVLFGIFLVTANYLNGHHLWGSSKTVDRREFQRHLDAQGGWYAIDWFPEYDIVSLKHDLNGVTYRFRISRTDEGVRESIGVTGTYGNVPVWLRDTKTNVPVWHRDTKTKQRGFDRKFEASPFTMDAIERLADQLWDAFMGATP